mmetsp:Transcript_109822/g.236326  ORF Transcript_109822/g.236326 Transcript_109822/m.236326 type:complete len:216 (-) Transcript_109822:109-756(-)
MPLLHVGGLAAGGPRGLQAPGVQPRGPGDQHDGRHKRPSGPRVLRRVTRHEESFAGDLVARLRLRRVGREPDLRGAVLQQGVDAVHRGLQPGGGPREDRQLQEQAWRTPPGRRRSPHRGSDPPRLASEGGQGCAGARRAIRRPQTPHRRPARLQHKLQQVPGGGDGHHAAAAGLRRSAEQLPGPLLLRRLRASRAVGGRLPLRPPGRLGLPRRGP